MYPFQDKVLLSRLPSSNPLPINDYYWLYILALLRPQSWIEYVSATAGKFDFNKISYQGMPKRLYTISGKIKID